MDSHEVEMDAQEGEQNPPKTRLFLESLTDSPGVQLIEDEKFDFDLSTTPKSKSATEDEDDDEIFFGEVGLKERCISKVVEEESKAAPVTPLSNEDWAKICVEAHKMASILQHATVSPTKRKKVEPVVALNETFDKDAEESPARLDLKFDLDDALELKVQKDSIVPPKDTPQIKIGLKRKTETPQSGLKRRSLPTAKSSSADPPVRKLAVPSLSNKGVRRNLVAPNKTKSSEDTSQLASKFQRSASFADRSKTQKESRSSTLTQLQRPAPVRSRLAKPAAVSTAAVSSEPKCIQPPKSSSAQPALKKPQIKSAMTSLSLMKHGGFQRGGLVRQSLRKPGTGAGQANGPLRATATTASKIGTPRMTSADSKIGTRGIKASPSTPRGRREGLTTNKRRLTTELPLNLTPIAPTLLTSESKLNSTLPCTPTGSTTSKRRSFLPTPGKQTASTSSSISRDSVSSLSSVDSPAMNTRGRASPMTGKLIDISDETSPKAKPPRVLYTPQLKENALPSKVPSRWSPLPKAKVIDSSDQYILCTKKLSQKF
ncbi:hypothetical protein CAPTEDRAFT_226040 [Capitella teleta]|uniref:G2 and S phase-expressed protein 1 N-terminal domain-containing protein n=1 Tax=Capitella teleta TaxID=283909 RepID=R7TTC8_CAPTE|nr:hypothetical protein CAPTEDRAFT_226040 [Capitella teleta]|eukprot:ELT94736.1 hypothetical protein CAPTEDRAFT_226040 [Capitella teleta]